MDDVAASRSRRASSCSLDNVINREVRLPTYRQMPAMWPARGAGDRIFLGISPRSSLVSQHLAAARGRSSTSVLKRRVAPSLPRRRRVKPVSPSRLLHRPWSGVPDLGLTLRPLSCLHLVPLRIPTPSTSGGMCARSGRGRASPPPPSFPSPVLRPPLVPRPCSPFSPHPWLRIATPKQSRLCMPSMLPTTCRASMPPWLSPPSARCSSAVPAKASSSGSSSTLGMATDCMFTASLRGRIPPPRRCSFGGKPTARIVGLVKSFDRFNTGMRVEGNIKRVEYPPRVWRTCTTPCASTACRYGFILTEIELVFCPQRQRRHPPLRLPRSRQRAARRLRVTASIEDGEPEEPADRLPRALGLGHARRR